ncbi:hypothetical protein, partial [Xanthomonas euvesicatoria]
AAKGGQAGSEGCSSFTTVRDIGVEPPSMNFDQEGIRPFLHELSSSIASNLDADALTEAIATLPVEQTGNWEFSVNSDGQTERLVIVAFKDDIDAPDLSFYTSPGLAAKIQRQLESFAQVQGW